MPLIKKLELVDGIRVGHPQIDSEHQELIDLANSLFEFVEEGDHDKFLEHLPRFVDGVSLHFSNEIEILKELGFPRVEKHAAFHAEALVGISEMAKRFAEGTEPIEPEHVQQEIAAILLHDFVRNDLEFKSFITEMRLTRPPPGAS